MKMKEKGAFVKKTKNLDDLIKKLQQEVKEGKCKNVKNNLGRPTRVRSRGDCGH